MILNDIATQRTPGRPIELSEAPNTALPSTLQSILLIGHMAATGGSATPYTIVSVNNVADQVAASGEVSPKFGPTSELTKMILAAITANSGGSTFPPITVIPLASGDTDFGTSEAALLAAEKVSADFVVSPYDANNSVLRGNLSDHCLLVSGATRTDNQQFGTTGVAANMSVTDPSTLPTPSTQYLSLIWLRDTSVNPYSLGELAAAAAAIMAGNIIPFNPLDAISLTGVTAPAKQTDWITVGAGLESESALNKGWTPLKVKPDGSVAFVRTVTSRITEGDGITPTYAYVDVQDFQVLYYWRKTLWTRFGQTDYANVKASQQKARDMKAEMIRLAHVFEDNNMFQAVNQLATQFVVQRNQTDRSRFDFFTPVNVIPGLHVIAGNIQYTTQYDSFTV